jgi:hypothetical protein
MGIWSLDPEHTVTITTKQTKHPHNNTEKDENKVWKRGKRERERESNKRLEMAMDIYISDVVTIVITRRSRGY